MAIHLEEFSNNIAENVPLLVLASASPQRLALLRQISIEPEYLYSPNIDKTYRRREYPLSRVKRLATEKAERAEGIVRSLLGYRKTLILAADTVVTVGRLVIKKPEDEKEAVDCLRLLSGRSHKVFTAICFITEEGHRRCRVVKNRVRFSLLDQQRIDTYVTSGEWKGKTGGYAIQGRAGAFVQRLIGSYSAVVGLPLAETSELLHTYLWDKK